MKKVRILLLILFLTLTFFTIKKTFALFETNVSGDAEVELAEWKIKVGDTYINTVTDGEFPLGSINWDSSSHTKEGKASPGSKGYFDIIINPLSTDVSILYEININIEELGNDNLKVVDVTEVNGHELIRTDKYKYCGRLTLDEINSGDTVDIKVNIEWVDSDSLDDYKLGDSNSDVDLKVDVNIIQSDGTEVISPYEDN